MPDFKRNSRSRKKIKPKKTSKTIKICFGILITVCFILLVIFFIQNNQINSEREEQKEVLKRQVEQIFSNESYNKIEGEKVEKTDNTVNIIALGNILYNHDLYENIYDNNNGRYRFMDYLYDVRDYIEVADYTIANLGVNFIGDYAVSEFKANAPEDLASAIKNVGIDLLNTANINSNNEGVNGIQKTLEKLDALKIEHTGTARAEIESKVPTIIDIKGIKVAFLSYTEKLNKPLSANNKYSVNLFDKNKVIEDSKFAKEKGADFIVLSLNTNNGLESNKYKELFNNGVGLILVNSNNGNIGKVDVIKNSEEENVAIANNTGNFIALNAKQTLEISLNIELTKSLEDGKTRITKINYNPMYILKKQDNSYLLIDIRQQIERYEAGLSSSLTKEDYEDVVEKLKNLDNLLNS